MSSPLVFVISLRMSDPNWLLSSLAQSAGALVAIIGGFLVSRLVGLYSQREGLRGRLLETEEMLKACQQVESDVRRDLVEWEKSLFVDCFIDDLAHADGEVAKLDLSECDVHSLTDQEIRECLDAQAVFVREAFEFFEQHAVSYNSPEKLEEFFMQHDLAVEDLDTKALSAVYDVLRERCPRPSSEPGRGVPRFLRSELLESSEMRSYRVMKSLQQQSFEANYHSDLIEKWCEAKREVGMRRAEHDVVMKRLRDLGNPSGLVWTALILAYLCITGVVVPLSLLPADTLTVEGKWIVLGLFFIGLVALLWNLIRSIHKLRGGTV